MRVANASASATASQRDMVQHGDVVAHHSGLSNDDTGRVIDHDAPPHLRARMDVDLHGIRDAALQYHGEGLRHTQKALSKQHLRNLLMSEPWYASSPVIHQVSASGAMVAEPERARVGTKEQIAAC